MAQAKVLITGGAGYIGSVLTPQLLNAGFAVTVLDNFLYGQPSLLENCWHPDFQIIRGDCRDERVLREATASADIIIALAALVGAPVCDEDRIAARTTNLEAIQTLLKLKSRQQWLLYPCTNSGYGVGEASNYCTEESPLKPISQYARDKVEAERQVLEAGNGVSLRLATVFGVSPRMRIDLLVNDFVHRAVTDRSLVIFEGHFKRNYIHIRDVARAFQHVMARFDAMKEQPYNVGLSDANLSKLELCAEIKKLIPGFSYLEAPIGEDPDKRDYIVSNAKIEATGFRPVVSLPDGINELKKAFTILRARRYSNV
ncbi:MAG: NAD(P)-dependent oxidoreductase [Acidobacteria bacterium]|nr:NAD(P)-dependent oxidoreductase [Acidobacteriota bacterium]